VKSYVDIEHKQRGIFIMLSICIPTYNRHPYLKACLESIFQGFDDYEYEVVIADGGSTDGTLDYLKSLDNVLLIEQGKLTGAVKAANECFRKASGDFIFLATDDFEIFPNVIIKTCEIMAQEPQLGLVGPKMQEIKHGNLHNVLLWLHPYWIVSPKIFIFQRKVLQEVKYFDEMFRTYYADVDIPLGVLKLGYSIAVTRDVGIIHHRIQDQKINIAKAENIQKKNTEFEYSHLLNKWKSLEIVIDEYMSKHTLKMKKSLRYKRYAATMYHSKKFHPLLRANPPISKWLYDWFLKKMVFFSDSRYDHLKSLFLVQKHPDEILSVLSSLQGGDR